MSMSCRMRINVIRTQQFYPLQVFFPIIWIEPFAQRVQPIISISSNALGNPASVLILNWNWRFWSLMIYIMLEFHLHHHEQPVQFERRSCNNIDCTLYTALKRRDQSSKIAIKCHFEQKLCFEEKTTWKIHSVFIFCTTQFCAMTDDCTNPSFYSFTFFKIKTGE